jgi:hypothetical protein
MTGADIRISLTADESDTLDRVLRFAMERLDYAVGLPPLTRFAVDLANSKVKALHAKLFPKPHPLSNTRQEQS